MSKFLKQSNSSLAYNVFNAKDDELPLDDVKGDNIKCHLPLKSKQHSTHKYSPSDSLQLRGYKPLKKLSKTLQGSIYLGIHIKTKEQVIIKRCDKTLHSKGITLINNHEIKIKEDILKEAKTLKYLTNNYNKLKIPNNFVKLLDFFEDDRNYFMIQEYGGICMFEYVSDIHEYIKSDSNKQRHRIKKWHHKCVKYFGQMLNTLNWLHNYMNVVHLDISLENTLIDKSNDKVNFIDFGLSEIINKETNKNCKKFVGKKGYKCPEINKKIVFNAQKSDVFALGVSWFMMFYGVPPFGIATVKDPYYDNIINGHLKGMLKDWKMNDYIHKDFNDLIFQMLTCEKDRITVDKLMQHKFFKRYKFEKF